MADPSAIAAAQASLRDLIAARALIVAGKVKVTEGAPSQGPKREHMWVSPTIDGWEQEPITTGTAATYTLEELFTLTVFTLVRRLGDNWPAARDRAAALAHEILEVCRADDTLGGAVFESFPIGGTHDEMQIDQATFAVIATKVRCRAELT